MSGWKTFCESFNTVQANEKTFPLMCDATTSRKSVQEIFALISSISQYDTNVKQMTDASVAASRQQLTSQLQENVYSFCCAVAERKQLEKTLNEAREDYEVAEARVKSVRNPAANISDRGTVFPFGRSLRPDSVPILLAVILSFCILSLGVLLGLGNIQIAYTGPRSTGPGFLETLYGSFLETNKWLILSIAVLAAGAAAGIFYAIQKTRPEWFGLKTDEQISQTK